MNTAKWDAFAEAFAAGQAVPANGWEAWSEQAVREATMIRKALPDTVQCLLEVGCGVGRLSPYLALMFPRVVCTDTSAACRTVTRERTRHHANVTVLPADARLPDPQPDAALVWGNLYDSDWTDANARAHLAGLVDTYPLVLCDRITRPIICLETGWSLTTSDDWCLISRP